MTRQRTLLFTLLMFTTAIAAVFVLTEFVAPSILTVPHLVYKFWGNRPATFYPDMLHRAVTPDYDVWFRSNSDGFKDIQHPVVKQKNEVRVLLLGDSYIEAAGVTPELHLARVLEQIAIADGRNVSVISMGMSGWGQAQQIATYERVGRNYDPDLVVTFFVGNDFKDNKKPTVWERPVFQERENSLVLDMPENELAESFEQKFARGLNRFESYFLLRYGWSVVYELYFATDDDREAAKLAADSEGSPRHGKLEKVRPPTNQLFEQLVSLLAENVVSRDGKKLTNVMITHKVKERHSPRFQLMKDYVRKVYASEGVETIDFENRFRTEYREKGLMPTLSSSDAHWGEHGHRMAAEELYSILFKSRSD